MSRFCVILLLALALPPATAQAADGDAARRAIQKLAPMQQIKNFRASTLPGYYEGVLIGQVVYASADGRYVIRGAQIDDTTDGTNLTDDSMAVLRLQALATIGRDQRLVYEPADAKYRITVFTDVDCPFCRRLHAQMSEYHKLGIAIDYVFFPLSIHPDADKKSADVWCSADPKRAYDTVMLGRSIDRTSCANPVVATKQIGTDIGINSTPTAVGPDGHVFTSTVLMSPQRLLAELQKSAAPKIADR